MKILFISTLYPVIPGHYKSEVITHALHNFVKEWNTYHEVLVIRPLFINANPLKPYYYYPKEIVSAGKYQLDNVKITTVPILRIPKTELYFYNFPSEINNFHPDIVVSHFGRSIFLGNKIASKLSIPHICGLHISDIINLKKGNKISRLLRKSIKKS